MAELDQIIPQVDGLSQITVTAGGTVDTFNYFNLDNFRNQNLLRSCKFAIRIDRHPNVLDYYSGTNLREFTVLCDSVEFPGRTITTSDFNIPGRQKVRTPYKRDFNEVTLTFYHNAKFPIYQYYSDWLDEISPNTTSNRYFDDVVNDIRIFQFYDTAAAYSTALGGGGGPHVKYTDMEVKLFNAYPVTVASLPSNWADDGFHKLTVTFAYEYTGMIDAPAKNLRNLGRTLNTNVDGQSLDDYLRTEGIRAGEKAKSDFLGSIQPPKINFPD